MPLRILMLSCNHLAGAVRRKVQNIESLYRNDKNSGRPIKYPKVTGLFSR